MARFDYVVVKTGRWKYGTQDVEVNILEIPVDFDYEFRKFEFEDMTDVKPNLNQAGKQFIITYGDISDFRSAPFFFGGSVKYGGLTLEEAEVRIKSLWQPIEWYK